MTSEEIDSDTRAAMQAAFTFSVNHMRKQGRRAKAPGGACVYRAYDGSMCAVGCLLRFDTGARIGGTARNGEVQRALREEFQSLRGDATSVEVLLRLQAIHDNYRSWLHDKDGREYGFSPGAEGAAREVAHHFGLTYTPPEAP